MHLCCAFFIIRFFPNSIEFCIVFHRVFKLVFRYGEQAGRITGDAMGAVGNAVEVR